MMIVAAIALVHDATAKGAQKQRQRQSGDKEFAGHRSFSLGAPCARIVIRPENDRRPSTFHEFNLGILRGTDRLRRRCPIVKVERPLAPFRLAAERREWPLIVAMK
jgi:hypothetical protein